MTKLGPAYIKELARRSKESHVYEKHQLMGLEIASALHDERHKSLYIKLAKERGGDELLRIAKEVAGRRGIKNPGAYFMAVLKSDMQGPSEKTASGIPRAEYRGSKMSAKLGAAITGATAKKMKK